MGNFVYGMNTSADLIIEQSAGENGGGDWLRIDEEFHRYWNERTNETALMVEGHVIYEIMESCWPAVASAALLPD